VGKLQRYNGRTLEDGAALLQPKGDFGYIFGAGRPFSDAVQQEFRRSPGENGTESIKIPIIQELSKKGKWF